MGPMNWYQHVCRMRVRFKNAKGGLDIPVSFRRLTSDGSAEVELNGLLYVVPAEALEELDGAPLRTT